MEEQRYGQSGSLDASFGSERLFTEAHIIEAAIANLYTLRSKAKAICESIVSNQNVDFAAVQLIHHGERAIYTIDGVGPKGEWSKIAGHPLDANPKYLDIQAHIAVSRPLRIEVIEGWDDRLDEFIFRKYRHDKYARAFLPLVVARNETGMATGVKGEEFRLEPQTIEKVVRTKGPEVPEVNAQLKPEGTTLTTTIHIPSSRSIDVIGTLEVGFDNLDRKYPETIDDNLVRVLFDKACDYAMELYSATLLHVLETIAASAKKIVNADRSSLYFWQNSDQKSYRYQIVGETLLSPALKSSEINLGNKAIETERTEFISARNEQDFNGTQGTSVRDMAALPFSATGEDQRALYSGSSNSLTGLRKDGFLCIAFDRDHEFSTKELAELALFSTFAQGAIRDAAHHVDYLQMSRQLANLHDMAKVLADDLAASDLLDSIAGHGLNLLAADLVIIYEYDGQQQRFIIPAAIQGRHESLSDGPGSDKYTPPLSPASVKAQVDCIRADGLNNVAVLYSEPVNPHCSEPVYLQSCSNFVAKEDIQTVLRVALSLGRELVGVMFINYRQSHSSPTYEPRIIQTLASTAAVAIHSRRFVRMTQDNLLAMTHQLRNPLSAMKIRARNISMQLRGMTVQGTHDLKDLQQESGKLANQLDILDTLCDGVFTTLSEQAGTSISVAGRQEINVKEEITRIWAFLATTRKREDLRFSLKLPHSRTAVLRLNSRVFTNVIYTLFHNAVKYAEPHSRVYCKWTFQNSIAILTLSTEGKPIHPEEKEAIFYKFYQGEEVRNTSEGQASIGLGLWVARQLMQLAGGNMWVELVPGDPELSIFVAEFQL